MAELGRHLGIGHVVIGGNTIDLSGGTEYRPRPALRITDRCIQNRQRPIRARPTVR